MAPATVSTASAAAPKGRSQGMGPKFTDKEKPASVRTSNICAAKSVADAVRTSLGPRGMDKMIQAADGEVTITNDGATILKQMSVIHPTARMVSFRIGIYKHFLKVSFLACRTFKGSRH